MLPVVVSCGAGSLSVISMGFLLRERDESVICRGPMKYKVIKEFLKDVEWGELDYLIMDMPPGTGDVQLTTAQSLPLTGAVIVSTPQDVALMDAGKALAMFQKLNVPILGMVENMTSFICPHCGEATDIFGHGGAQAAARRLDVPFLGEIPLTLAVRTGSDSGRPIVVDAPDSPEAAAFRKVSKSLAAQVSILAYARGAAAGNGPGAPLPLFRRR